MVRALHDVIIKSGGPVNDRIMDQKPVLVTWNQDDTTRRQITKLSHFVEAGRSNISVMRLWSDQLVTESVSLPTAHTHSAYPQRRNHGSQAGTRLLEPSRQAATTSNQTPLLS
jgi:hypothetical protein